jgi:hypothetical protein
MRLSLSFKARQSGFPFSGSINWLALGAVSNHVAQRMTIGILLVLLACQPFMDKRI